MTYLGKLRDCLLFDGWRIAIAADRILSATQNGNEPVIPVL